MTVMPVARSRHAVDGGNRLADYDLRVPPFEPTPDPTFLWLGKQQREALATLRAAVSQPVDLLILTGDAGMGKTTLANALSQGLRGDGTIIGWLREPRQDPAAFRLDVADTCRLPGGSSDREAFLGQFTAFLRDAHARGKRVLLIIDEAHSLTRPLFREIAALVESGQGLPGDATTTLRVFLVGQPSLTSVLKTLDNAELLRRVNVRARVGALSKEETGEYIQCRLKAAGTERRLFTAGAVQQAWALSGGIPGQINAVCARALLEASRRGAPLVTAEIVRECGGGLPEPIERAGLPRRLDAVRSRRRVRQRSRSRWRQAVVLVLSLAAGVGLVLTREGAFSRSVPDQTRRSSVSEGPVEESVNALVEPPRTQVVGRTDNVLPAERGLSTGRLRSATSGRFTGLKPPEMLPAVAAGAAAPRAPAPEFVPAPSDPSAGASAARVSPSGSGATDARAELSDPAAIIDWLLHDSRR